MIGQWMTMKEAQWQFDASRSTINRWREIYPIREVKFGGLPMMLHGDDLANAEAQASSKNPVIR